MDIVCTVLHRGYGIIPTCPFIRLKGKIQLRVIGITVSIWKVLFDYIKEFGGINFVKRGTRQDPLWNTSIKSKTIRKRVLEIETLRLDVVKYEVNHSNGVPVPPSEN